jgi:hypothetical protein
MAGQSFMVVQSTVLPVEVLLCSIRVLLETIDYMRGATLLKKIESLRTLRGSDIY